MKWTLALVAVLASLAWVTPARAIERDAAMIDWIGVEYGSFSGGDSLGLVLWGEAAMPPAGGDWAILAGGRFGTITAGDEDVSDTDYWRVCLGIKYYLFQNLSLALIGSYARYDADAKAEATAATALAKFRLLSADGPISPYVFGSATAQAESSFSDSDAGDVFPSVVLQAGAGCDFAMTDELTFLFEASGLTSEHTDGGTVDFDGVLVCCAMKYYWR
jgi:hypothetical protein